MTETSAEDVLRAFAQKILEGYPEGGPDEFTIWDLAVEHGLLMAIKVTEPCAEDCWCTEYYSPEEMKDGVDCYRRTKVLTG